MKYTQFYVIDVSCFKFWQKRNHSQKQCSKSFRSIRSSQNWNMPACILAKFKTHSTCILSIFKYTWPIFDLPIQSANLEICMHSCTQNNENTLDLCRKALMLLRANILQEYQPIAKCHCIESCNGRGKKEAFNLRVLPLITNKVVIYVELSKFDLTWKPNPNHPKV